MNKKLVAVAVAGLFAAPVAALAQSSVTISGFLKGGIESNKLGNPGATTPSSSVSVVDDSSRIIFNVVEDLGGGLQAIGQLDMRMSLDQGALAGVGNNHVGLRSKSWGRLFFGRQDLHYFNRESDLTAKASLRGDSISILAFAGGGGQAIAGATRTANVVHYTTPNWGGFTLIAAYSSSGGGGADGDIGAGAVRKGSAWNLNPNMAGSNWQVGYSYWKAKPDAGGNTLATGDQRADRLYGSYRFPMGLKIGLAWDKSKINGATNGVELSNRTAWSLPLSYTWGNHSIHAHFDKARNDRSTAADDAASMFAIAYAYDLSKRTSAALTYARINNNAGAAYNLFTGVGLGGSVIAPTAGQDPRMFGFTMRHAF
jgi:predicted porin